MATFDDSLGRAQDVKRCKLCPGKDRKSAAETICSSCRVNLCKDCVGHHVISDPGIKHDVVTFQFNKSEIIPPQCSQHQEEKCDIFCLQCNSLVCLKCLTSGSHENHDVQQFSEIYKSIRDMIIKDNNELETNIAPVYESILSDIDTVLTNVVHQHEERNQIIIKFGEKCHRCVDTVIKRYLNESKETRRKDTASLLVLKQDFKMIQSSIRSAINENKSTLDSSDSSKLIHYTSRTEDFRYVPSRFELTVPQLYPVELTEQLLCQMIGVIPNTTRTIIQAFKSKQFVDKPIVIETVNTGYGENNGIKCTPKTDQFYVSGNREIIKRMNTEGELLEEIITSGGIPYDIAVTREGYVVYTESLSIGINIIKSDMTERLISPQDWVPMVLCCTSRNELLVAMKSVQNNIKQSKILVIRCSDCTITQEIQYDNAGKALYSFPFCIQENGNSDIIVSDYDVSTVVVVDKVGNFKYNYSGNLQSKRHKTFTPCGLTTDSMCHILIADPRNNVIHIDQNGHFLFFIADCELQAPFDLSIDGNDNLFVAERVSGKVKKIKLFKR